MKYILRSFKYFVKLALFLVIIIFIMYKLGFVEGRIDAIFVNGKDSFWQIGLMLLAFAAIYPRFGYCSRDIVLPGATEEIVPEVKKTMEFFDYQAVKEDADVLVFRKRNFAAKLLRMGEDKVTMTRTMNGFSAEGASKDIIRIANHFTTYSTRDPE